MDDHAKKTPQVGIEEGGGEREESPTSSRSSAAQQPVRNFRRTLATARPSTGGRNSDPAVAKRMAEEWKARQHKLGIVDGQSYGHWKDGKIGGTWVAVDPSSCAPPPVLDPAQSVGQHNQPYARSSPDLQYQYRAVCSVDTNPFSVESLNELNRNLHVNKNKRPRASSEETVFDDPWEGISSGTTVEGASAKINELRRSLGDFGSQRRGPNQNRWRGSNRHHHGGRGRGNNKRRRGGSGGGRRGRGRGNSVYRGHLPMSFSGRR